MLEDVYKRQALRYYVQIKTKIYPNSILLLIIFIVTFFVVVIWLDIFNAPHNSIIEITRTISAVTECVSSIACLVTVIMNCESFVHLWDHLIEADVLLFSLGLDLNYTRQKRESTIYLICFCLIHILLFTADYFLLTRASDNVFVLSSFIVVVIHTTHNSSATGLILFCVYTMQQRFCLLNAAMRNLQDVDVVSILNELPLNKPLSRITVLTMLQQVERIKLAHDKYVGVCDNINKMRHISTWLEVTVNTGVITCLLYTSRCV